MLSFSMLGTSAVASNGAKPPTTTFVLLHVSSGKLRSTTNEITSLIICNNVRFSSVQLHTELHIFLQNALEIDNTASRAGLVGLKPTDS